MNVFPSQIAYICRHPELDQFDLSSVVVFTTTGSTINPVYERQIYDKVPRLIKLGMVSLYVYESSRSISRTEKMACIE